MMYQCKVNYRIGSWLSVDFAKNKIGIGKIQNSHIGTPLIHAQ